MAEFKRVVITRKGQALMAKLMSGSGTTHFTAIKVSDSSFNEDQLEGLTSIGNVKQTVSISKVDRTNNVAAEVEGAISNTNLTVGYYMRTLGLYAQDPDEGEILYAVTIASQAGYMPPFNGKTTSGAFFRITTTIGNADNLNVQVNPSAVATIGEINDLQKQIDAMKDVDKSLSNRIEVLEKSNLVLYQRFTNKDQDNEIAVLQNRASDLEANRQTIHLLGHDWSGLSDHTSDSFKATRQFIVNDTTLTSSNAFANAKATGDAIKQNYQQLSQAIGIIYAWLDNLGNQQVIVDIKNRLSALEDSKKETK